MIFIASSSFDAVNWQPVAQGLRAKGYEVLVYEADKVAAGSVQFSLVVSDASDVRIMYDNAIVDVSKISAAWYRRPSIFGVAHGDRATWMSINKERVEQQEALWRAIPQHVWLNSPSNILGAEDKISQLTVAKRVGFSIPYTVITNDWNQILDSLPQDIIHKPVDGLIYTESTPKVQFTTALTNNRDDLPLHAVPFPGLWQPNIAKAKEWRITIVGDQSFDAAIYATGEGKDDWRKASDQPEYVRFAAETFPARFKQKCFAYLAAQNLRYGAFDFIERKDGGIVFLECNPNGQYGWLEQEIGLPITEAIVHELSVIAKR